MTCLNYAVADWASLGHIIVTRHCMKNKGRLDLTTTVVMPDTLNEKRFGIGWYCAFETRLHIANRASPFPNGFSRVAISIKIHPSPQTSAGLPYDSCFNISGAQYVGVPTNVSASDSSLFSIRLQISQYLTQKETIQNL